MPALAVEGYRQVRAYTMYSPLCSMACLTDGGRTTCLSLYAGQVLHHVLALGFWHNQKTESALPVWVSTGQVHNVFVALTDAVFCTVSFLIVPYRT